jgi:hypothetical protein
MSKLSPAFIRRLMLSRVSRSEIVKELGTNTGANAAVRRAAEAEGCVYEWWNKGQGGRVAYHLRQPVSGEQAGHFVLMND